MGKFSQLYRVTIARCIDDRSFDVEVSVIGDRAITPGQWLPNRASAQLWAARAIEGEMWKTFRRWRNSRPYLV